MCSIVHVARNVNVLGSSKLDYSGMTKIKANNEKQSAYQLYYVPEGENINVYDGPEKCINRFIGRNTIPPL